MTTTSPLRRLARLPLRSFLLMVMVWGLIISGIYDERRNLIAETMVRNDAIAATLALQTAETLLQVDQMLAGMVRDIADLHMPVDGPGFHPRLHDVLARRAASEPGIASLFVTDEYGIVRHSSHEPISPGADQSTREWYISPAGSTDEVTHIAATIRLRLSNDRIAPGFVMSRRLGRDPETFNGVVAATVPIANLTGIYARLLPAEGQTIALWRDDGALMAEWPNRHGEYPTQRVQEKLHGANDADGLVIDALSGREVIRASAEVPGFPLHVVISTDLAPLLAEHWDRTYYRGVVVACLTTLALALTAWWMYHAQERTRRLRANAQRAQNRLAAAVAALDELVWTFEPRQGALTILGRESIRHAELHARLEAAFGLNGAQPPAPPARLLRDVDWPAQEVVIEQPVPQADGSIAWLLVRGHGVHDENGRLIEVEGIAGDITARKIADGQVQHSRRLQALGQLTGGIAHDFNNLLGVVVGNLELVSKTSELAPSVASRLDSALTAAMRGADLTAKLLGFSRPHAERAQVVDCNRIVEIMHDLIAPVLPPTVSLTLDLTAQPCLADIDDGGLQDALMNLALNARDAMPEGGRLEISTSREDVEEPEALNLSAAGPYVVITMRDTGSGMTPEVLERIFEPYFTTKEVGRGTGLGLSQVFGFAHSARGSVRAQSTPERGSTFQIYLPAVEELPTEVTDGTGEPLPGGEETILVVADDRVLLATMAQQLDLLGYRVIAVPDGDTALSLLREPISDIDLVLSDMAMRPPVDGVSLARAARDAHPDLPIVLIADSPTAALDWTGAQGAMPWVVDKPLTLGPLAHLIRSALGDD